MDSCPPADYPDKFFRSVNEELAFRMETIFGVAERAADYFRTTGDVGSFLKGPAENTANERATGGHFTPAAKPFFKKYAADNFVKPEGLAAHRCQRMARSAEAVRVRVHDSNADWAAEIAANASDDLRAGSIRRGLKNLAPAATELGAARGRALQVARGNRRSCLRRASLYLSADARLRSRHEAGSVADELVPIGGVRRRPESGRARDGDGVQQSRSDYNGRCSLEPGELGPPQAWRLKLLTLSARLDGGFLKTPQLVFEVVDAAPYCGRHHPGPQRAAAAGEQSRLREGLVELGPSALLALVLGDGRGGELIDYQDGEAPRNDAFLAQAQTSLQPSGRLRIVVMRLVELHREASVPDFEQWLKDQEVLEQGASKPAESSAQADKTAPTKRPEMTIRQVYTYGGVLIGVMVVVLCLAAKFLEDVDLQEDEHDKQG
ncbi:unnamed protein product [Prorocentrum cordatum]|uniref:Uncharacterized protein n=1 Tax=Prorocentrum cordatum TaxID=2364126 RepID=A0ABN9R980_9DINO|nr:unnamed protein product [Polarella glacialis]